MDLQEGRERAKGCLLVVLLKSLLVVFCKIALLCKWGVSKNAVCVFIKHIWNYSVYKVEMPFFNVCILTFSFAQGHKRVSAKYE